MEIILKSKSILIFLYFRMFYSPPTLNLKLNINKEEEEEEGAKSEKSKVIFL